MRNLFGIFGAIIVLLGLTSATTAQSTPTISVTPASGPPGTGVVITDTSGGAVSGMTCFATVNGQNFTVGVMQNAPLTFIVPTFTTPGSTVVFVCAGRSGRTNTVAFVAASVLILTDSDSDGVVDAVDACPSEPGTVENNGCPAPTPLPPSPTAAIILPDLPTGGACVLATLEAGAVNIRQQPTTESDIVGQLDPLQIYSVIGRNADFSWYQVAGGWVAAFVTRQGGDCPSLPQTDSPPTGGSGDFAIPSPDSPLPLLLPAVQKVREAAARMQNCPDLFPTVDSLPTFLTLYIVGEPNPCAFAEAELSGLFLSAQPDPSAANTDQYFEDVLEICPDYLGYTYDFFSLLASVEVTYPAAWQDITSRISQDNICLVVYEWATSYLNPFAFQDSVVNQVAIAYCTRDVYNPLGPTWRNRIESYLDFLEVSTGITRVLQPKDYINPVGGCVFIDNIRPLGVINTGNALFYSQLISGCNISESDAAERALLNSVRGGFDGEAAANMGCAGYDQYTSLPLPPDLQPTLPQIAQDAECQGNFRLLASHNAALAPELLFRILTALNPCTSATEYVYYGGLSNPNQLPLPECFVDGGVVISAPTLAGEAVNLTAGSSWRQKMLILDRPLNEICSYIDLSPGSEVFALQPTVDALDLAAAPTPTLPIIGIAPTNTPPIIGIAPTDTPLGLAAAATNTPPVTDDPGLLPTSPPLLDSSPTPTDPVVVLPTATTTAVVQPDVIDDPLPDQWGGILAEIDALGNQTGKYYVTSVRHRFFAIVDRTQLSELPLDRYAGLRTDYPISVAPGGDRFAYFADDTATGNIVLQVREVGVGASETITIGLSRTESFTPLPVAPIWSPDGGSVLITATNAAGAETVAFWDADEPTDQPYFVIDNASTPSISPNNRLIAFERRDPNGRNLYVMAVNSREITPITQQPPGSECFGAQFGQDSLTLFFTCITEGTSTIYRYGLAGIAPLNTGIANAQNPLIGPDPGTLFFDDGIRAYISRDDGSNAAPLPQIPDLNLRPIQFTPPRAEGDPLGNFELQDLMSTN